MPLSPTISRRFLLVAGVLSLALAGTSSAQLTTLPDAFTSDQLLWEREFGVHQYTVPLLDGDRLFVGVNDSGLEHPAVDGTGGGILMSLDPATGEQHWQFPIPRYMDGKIAPFHFNHWRCGICSTPAIAEDRLYVVGPRGEILCFDREGQSDGNDGPVVDELEYIGVPEGSDYELTDQDGDMVWRYNLITELGVVPHDVCGSSPTLHNDLVYACTSNGVDHTHGPVANPNAPALVVLDRHTGRLVATDGAVQGTKILHGNWSSPAVMELDGQATILFGGGDGILYAFIPPTGVAEDGVQTLKTRWTYDCCPKDYREKDGVVVPYSRFNKKRTDGPSEVISTPIISDDGRIYVGIGQSPVHGPGQGALSCIDGRTGKRIWVSRDVSRTLTDVALHDDLVFAADIAGRLNCIEAETGKLVWQRELGAGVWCATPVIVKDRVYVSTEKQTLWCFSADRDGKVLAESRMRSVGITPRFIGDVFYLPTQRRLFAIQLEN